MKVDGKPYRTIWLGADGTTVQAIDQTLLPHKFVVRDFRTMEDAEVAIRTMIVRGAPLIGAAALNVQFEPDLGLGHGRESR